MSDNLTQENPDARSFEERVFARFDTLDARLTALDGRLPGLEEKVDSRLRETRPIWEAMQARLDGIEGEIKTVHREMRLPHNDVLRTRLDQEELRERLDKLESEPIR